MIALELKWWLAALIGGGGCGAVGYLLLCLNLPFLGVALAHAALAGAVGAVALGLPPVAGGGIAAMISAALLGPVADRLRLSLSVLSSVLFSLSMGLAFLGIALVADRRAEMLALMWGSVLMVRWIDLTLLGAVTALFAAFMLRHRRAIKAVLFDRTIAAASGIPADRMVYTLLGFLGLMITLNLTLVGGLMLFCLISLPPAAARQWTPRYAPGLLLATLLAAASAAGGLTLSLLLDWPAGASMVIVSTLLFVIASLTRTTNESGPTP